MAEQPDLAGLLTNIQAQLQTLGDRMTRLEQPPAAIKGLRTHIDEVENRIAVIERPARDTYGADPKLPKAPEPPDKRFKLDDSQMPPSRRTRIQKTRNPNLKLSAPIFEGRADPEVYLEWERSMDQFFRVYHYEERRKVHLAVSQLTGDAKIWWDREGHYLRRTRSGPVASWDLMKFIMNHRYVPPFYFRGLEKKFRSLTQGSRSVEEYLGEFEHLRDRLQLEDDEETLMSHFLYGLQDRIARQVERRVYRGFEELVLLAIQIETLVKRRCANVSRSRVQAPAPRVLQMPVCGSSSRPTRVDTAANSRVIGIPSVAIRDTQDEVRNDLISLQIRDEVCSMCRERGHLSRDCSNQTAIVLTSSGENQSQEQVEPPAEVAEHLDDEVTCPKVRDDLALRIVTEGPMVFVRLWDWSWLRNVFLGNIPTRLPPKREIDLQFECALGTRCIALSPPLIQYKEEPPDFVRNTLTFTCPNSNIAAWVLIVDIEFPARLGVFSSGLYIDYLPRILDLGFRAVPLVLVDYSALLSALMLASSLYYFAGANREFQDDQWVKENPPDVIHELSLVVTSGRSRSETRYSVSYTLTFDLSKFVNSCLELIAYDRELDRLGVAHARMDLSCLIVGLDPRFRQGIWDCICFDALLDNMMLATRSLFLAGTSRLDRIDQWVKEKPPDLILRVHGAEMRRSYQVQRSKLQGKVDTILLFTEFDLCFTFAGSVCVLRSKPLEEGGNDRSMDQQLVAEEQLEPEELGSQRIGGRLIMWVAWGMVAGLSTFADKGVWTLFSQEGEGLAPPTLH